MASEPLISAQAVSLCYPQGSESFFAVRSASIDLLTNELVLLMGASGSGKTTLLQMLALLLVPSEGEVFVRGKATSNLSSQQRSNLRRNNIGIVFQNHNLIPTLTARENIELVHEFRGYSPRLRAKAAAEALERVGIGDRAASYPNELSGGQRQRVAIARAIIGSPAVVLADEPTAALDTTAGVAIMRLLQSLSAEGTAIAVVTHDPRAVDYADRVHHIRDGKIAPRAEK
jgi:putative ABC transport system ATP-binding protein